MAYSFLSHSYPFIFSIHAWPQQLLLFFSLFGIVGRSFLRRPCFPSRALRNDGRSFPFRLLPSYSPTSIRKHLGPLKFLFYCEFSCPVTRYCHLFYSTPLILPFLQPHCNPLLFLSSLTTQLCLDDDNPRKTLIYFFSKTPLSSHLLSFVLLSTLSSAFCTSSRYTKSTIVPVVKNRLLVWHHQQPTLYSVSQLPFPRVYHSHHIRFVCVPATICNYTTEVSRPCL